jgi:hypothetical protein
VGGRASRSHAHASSSARKPCTWRMTAYAISAISDRTTPSATRRRSEVDRRTPRRMIGFGERTRRSSHVDASRRGEAGAGLGTGEGGCRITQRLAEQLGETCEVWRSQIAPVVEQAANTLACVRPHWCRAEAR